MWTSLIMIRSYLRQTQREPNKDAGNEQAPISSLSALVYERDQMRIYRQLHANAIRPHRLDYGRWDISKHLVRCSASSSHECLISEKS